MSDNSQPATNDDNQRLVDQYHEIAALAGGLAHEIKNPLSTIALNMELLAEDFADAVTPRDRRALNKINIVQRECQRLQNVLDEFLNFAKVRRVRLEPADLNAEVERMLTFFQPKADEGRIEIIRYLETDLPHVLLDRETFQAVLFNLALNAQQAMPDGGQLLVRTRQVRGGVALDLIDTGGGIDEETLPHVFEAFYSTKPAGSGLGLPTAKKIVEAHGGRIFVESEPGRGTMFTIALPTPRRLVSDADASGPVIFLPDGDHRPRT
jgi:signal transduction histidine kinase